MRRLARFLLPCLAILVSVGVTVCSPLEDVRVEVPPDIAVGGVVRLDADDAVIDGSALVPWTSSLPVFAESNDTTVLVGFTDAQLAPYPDLVGSGDRLQGAVGCTNRLPAPSFAVVVSSQGAVPVSPDLLPAISTSMVASTCPHTAPGDWAVDVTCFDRRCRPVVRTVDACTVVLDLGQCGGGEVQVTVDAHGQGCAVYRDGAGACETAPDAYSTASFECTADAERQCRIHIYRDARNVPAPFTALRKKWAEGGPLVPAFVNERVWIGARSMRTGYASGMTLLDGRVIVSGPSAEDEFKCTVDSGLFYLIDAESLDTRIVPGVGCAQALSADPGGQTFLGAHAVQNGWQIGRFDRDGRLLDSKPVGDAEVNQTELPTGFSLGFRPEVILRPPDSEEVWLVMYDNRNETNLPGTIVIPIDPETLVARPPVKLSEWRRSFSAAVTRSDEYAIVAEISASVGWFDNGASEPSVSHQVPEEDIVKNVLYTLLPLGPDRLLLTARGYAPAMVVDRDGTIERMAHPAGEEAQVMMRLADWDGPIKLAVGMQTINDGRREAIVALLDSENDRFLPGAWVIGDGMPSFTQTDALGRHYVLLPWFGDIVRIDPHPED